MGINVSEWGMAAAQYCCLGSMNHLADIQMKELLIFLVWENSINFNQFALFNRLHILWGEDDSEFGSMRSTNTVSKLL
jgi:hypothetical protein